VTHGPVDGECRYGKNPRPARRGLKVSGGRGGETVQLLLASPDGRPRTARLTLSLAPFLFESLTKVIPSHPHLLAAPWFSQIVPLSMSVLSFFLFLEELCSSCSFIDTIRGERESGVHAFNQVNHSRVCAVGSLPTFSRPRNMAATFAAKRHRRSGDLISVNLKN
jgi:hypothetical protein